MCKGVKTGISLLALMASGSALAQTLPAPSAADDPTAPQNQADTTTQPSTNDDIIVTASKRPQTLQDTPIAVSVTSAETIEEAQIRDLIDLQSVVPSLRVIQAQSSGQTIFLIRGFGTSSQNPGLEPSVGVFVDGVYRSRSSAQIVDLPNIERIEVLRGPQSTLFGKNAAAGVISVVTQKPQFEFGGSLEATYGNFDQYIGKGYVTGPIIADVLAFSIGGNYNKRDGYFRVINTGDRINDRDRYDVRGQLLFAPSDNLEVRLIGDYSKIDELCCAGPLVLGGPTVSALNAVIGGPAVISPPAPFSDQIRLSRLPQNDIESYGGSAQIDYTAGQVTLTSITAYRELRSDVVDDGDFTAASITENNIGLNVDTFTQELRIASNLDGPLNFLLGGFYFNENINYTNALVYGAQARPYLNLLAGNSNIPGIGTIGNIALVELLTGRPRGTTFFQAGPAITDVFQQDNEAYSIFGTVDYKLTDRLTLTGGFNYTNDKKKVDANVTSLDQFSALNLTAINPGFAGLRALQFLPPFVNYPNSVENGRSKDDDWSYTVRISYEVSDAFNVYATYATGFKATSWNLSRDSRPFASDLPAIRGAGLAPNNLTTGTRFAGPEESEVYEFGLKANFDRVRFNIAIFDQTIEGFQSNAFTGTGFALTNAGEQSTKGFEVEGTVTPVDPFTAFVNFTYLNAKYDSFTGSPVGDLSGQDVETVAPFNLSIGGTYTQELGGDAKLLLRGDYQYSGTAQAVQFLPGYLALGGQSAAVNIARNYKIDVDQLNMSATVELGNGFEVSGFVRNLLDDRYLVTVFDGVAQTGNIYGYPNQPRTYGGSARFKF